MKRITLLLLAILMLLPLASCGKKKIDNSLLSSNVSEVVSLTGSRVGIISGGAWNSMVFRNTLLGEAVEDNSKNPTLFCFFDDTTKVLYPLCFNATCQHISQNDCFACNSNLCSSRTYTTVTSNHILSIVHNTRYSTSAVYYSFDGTIQKEIEYNLDNLLLPNGAKSDIYLDLLSRACRYNDKLYFPVINYDSSAALEYDPSDKSSDKIYYVWIVCFDMTEEEFFPVSGFELPHPYKILIDFKECTESKLSLCYSDVYYYIVDVRTGAVEEEDIDKILSELVSNGKIPMGVQHTKYLPLKGLLEIPFYNSDKTIDHYEYFNTETFEKVVLTETEIVDYFRRGGTRFLYNQKKYYMFTSDPETSSYRVVSSSGETEVTGTSKIFKNRHGKESCYYTSSSGGFESENGFIYVLWEKGQQDRETRIENGVEVVYFLPYEFVYISKADILDGGEVTPWYYDPETGTFAQ